MRPKEEGRHAVSKIIKAVSMKVAIEDSRRCNIPEVRKRLKTVKGEELLRLKDFDSILSNNTGVETPIHAKNTPYMGR